MERHLTGIFAERGNTFVEFESHSVVGLKRRVMRHAFGKFYAVVHQRMLSFLSHLLLFMNMFQVIDYLCDRIF